MIRAALIFWLIVYSVRRRVLPYHFFQLNCDYFNPAKNIFSKLDMDRHIPAQWRLLQVEDDGVTVPDLPVFFKPEWGQNSHGVYFIRNTSDLRDVRKKRVVKKTACLLQAVAWERREYDIFYIRSAEKSQECGLLSVTEVTNSGASEPVVNGVHNKDSSYHEITADFTSAEQRQLWEMVRDAGRFQIARIGLRADSKEDLLAGNFHIIEVNIFLPMPLLLLDESISFADKYQFIKKSMALAVCLIANLPRKPDRHAIFFRQLVAHYKVKGC
ncbi:MAG: hypothetical protein JRJ68_06610 [Deltaproteobacteria bacterium]|nr:hypothetical protein [Deltaproteobacteria bacterium]